MIKADKEKLHAFFAGSNQFKIPFFQRAYVWKQENWNEIWENILEEIAELKAGNNESEHFIGTVIIKQADDTGQLGTLIYDLIDGQQRLTTICLLLKALHDVATDANFKTWISNLLVFTDSYGNQKIRLIHSKNDTTYFQKIIVDKDDNKQLWEESKKSLEKTIENSSKITGAYLFFRNKIQTDIDPNDIRSVVTILLEKLPVIHMALSKNDDVQQIFDTINSLGVKLTTGELLKNYLFSFQAVEANYKTYWEDIFEADEDAIDFWNAEKTSGRVIRTTIELFLYSYLVILKNEAIRIESLFKEYKTFLKGKSDAELIAFAKELSEYAKLYATMPDGENLADINFKEHDKRFFHVMRELDITTVFPLVLFIYKNVTDVTERNKILNCLESYLVRRTICKLTTKNYNNLFLSLLNEFKKLPQITEADVKTKLLSFTEDSNRFPTDEDLLQAFHTSHLINQYSREVLYCIALYQLDNDYQDNRKLNFNGFTVEHIMPKKWRNNWNGHPDWEEDETDMKLRTLGNLTLIMGKLNSSMRDSAWSNKKKALTKFSTLRITTDYLQIADWNEDEIYTRCKDLCNLALKIWKR